MTYDLFPDMGTNNGNTGDSNDAQNHAGGRGDKSSRNRKTARIVEFPERPLTQDEFEEYRDHARNSTIWYAGRFVRNCYQVKKKLYDKGYPRHEVLVDGKDGEFHFDFAQDAADNAVANGYIDELNYAESVARGRLSSGAGLSVVRQSLMEKRFPGDIVDEVIASIDDDDATAAFDKVFDQAVRSTASEGNPWKRKQKIVKRMATKGFNLSEVFSRLEDLEL